MRRGSRSLATAVSLLVCAATLAACGPADGGDGAPERAESPPAERDAPKNTPTTRTTRTNGANKGTHAGGGEAGFVAAAETSGGTAGAADRIRGFELRVFEGYERVLISFGGGDGGAPGVPVWSLQSPREGGYVRLQFPGVSSTETGDEDLVGLVTDGAYVVRDPGGGMFVDVFALRSFRYRVTGLPETGRLAVDFRPADGGFRYAPVRGENAVVVQPREGEEARSPLTVRGYSHLPGATTVSLLGREGRVISSRTVRAGGAGDGAGDRAWNPYEATLRPSGYKGYATLRVGEANPRGGPRGITYEGAKAEIFVE